MKKVCSVLFFRKARKLPKQYFVGGGRLYFLPRNEYRFPHIFLHTCTVYIAGREKGVIGSTHASSPPPPPPPPPDRTRNFLQPSLFPSSLRRPQQPRSEHARKEKGGTIFPLSFLFSSVPLFYVPGKTFSPSRLDLAFSLPLHQYFTAFSEQALKKKRCLFP